MKKFATIIILTALLLPGTASCSYAATAEESMVAVWASTDKEAQPFAYGLVVGDGTQILTFIDYENIIPKDIFIGRPGQARYPASVQAIDSNTNVTLLKMTKRVFRPAAITSSTDIPWGSVFIMHGWAIENIRKMDRRQVIYFQAGAGVMQDPLGPYNDMLGALITTKSGKIIGLLGFSYTDGTPFNIILGPIGRVGPMVGIHDALKVLSPDNIAQSWAEQPVFSYIADITNGEFGKPFLPPADKDKYNRMSAALLSLFNTMGDALPPNEPLNYYLSYTDSKPASVNSTLFTAVYPKKVDLKNSSGQIVASVGWIGIQWGRSDGGPNYLFYGHFDDFAIDGGFILNGNVTALKDSVY